MAALFFKRLVPRGLATVSSRTAETILDSRRMTCNMNAIPNDPQTPFVTSGIRLGSPAMTTCGFKEAESIKVANLLADVLDNPEDFATMERVRAEAKQLTMAFPVCA